MAETLTDTNGFYHLKFEADDLASNYYLAHETPITNHFGSAFQRVSIQPGQEQQRRLDFLPHSWLRLRVTNVNPNIKTDELRIFSSPTARYSFTGPYTGQAIAQLPGNQSYTALCTLIRDNQSSPFQFTVYLARPRHRFSCIRVLKQARQPLRMLQKGFLKKPQFSRGNPVVNGSVG